MCDFIGQRQINWIGQFALSSLLGPTVQVLSTLWADSTVVPNAKLHCVPWVTVPLHWSPLFFELELV